MAFLGGLPPDGENKVDATTVYGGLAARGEDLLSKNTIKLKKDWTETVFQTLWEGEFIVDWQIVAEVTKGVPMFVFTGIVQDERVPVRHRGGVITWVVYEDSTGDDAVMFCDLKSTGVENTEGCNHSFLSTLSKNKQTRLGIRIAHRIYRTIGAQLPPDYEHLLFCICHQHSSTRDAYSDVLDVAITAADISINTQQSSVDIENNLGNVAECLEALGRYADAASLYQEVAVSPTTEAPAEYWGNAGLARMRNCEYTAAESMYLKALNKLCLEHLDFSDKCTWVLFSYLLYMYCMKTDQFHTSFTERSHVRAKTAFLALLFAAGFDVQDKRALHVLVNIEGKELYRYLKTGLKSAAKATRALLKAVRSADTKEYRAVLMSCIDPNKEIAPRNWVDFEPSEQMHLRLARKTIEDPFADGQVTLLCCSNPGCRVEGVLDDEHCTLRQCPCKTVNYCSTECQLANWPVHKHHCSKRGSKKKGGKKKSGGADKGN
jgi:tetratricopeptide (TPR) repeat protein